MSTTLEKSSSSLLSTAGGFNPETLRTKLIGTNPTESQISELMENFDSNNSERRCLRSGITTRELQDYLEMFKNQGLVFEASHESGNDGMTVVYAGINGYARAKPDGVSLEQIKEYENLPKPNIQPSLGENSIVTANNLSDSQIERTAALMKEFFGGWDADAVNTNIVESNSPSSVILDCFGNPIGSAYCELDPLTNTGEITEVCVASKHQGKGLGHFLIKNLLGEIRNLNQKNLVVFSESNCSSRMWQIAADNGLKVQGILPANVKVNDELRNFAVSTIQL